MAEKKSEIGEFFDPVKALMEQADAAGLSIEFTISDRTTPPTREPDGITITMRSGWFSAHDGWHDDDYRRRHPGFISRHEFESPS